MKYLCDRNERSGLQLPNLYHEAVALSWTQEWLKLESEQMLNLEDHNLVFGWHAYLFYQKHKNYKLFKHHIIRNSLHSIWQKYQKYLGDQTPLWLVPMEIIKLHSEYNIEEKLTYRDLTCWRGNEIRMKEEKEVPV